MTDAVAGIFAASGIAAFAATPAVRTLAHRFGHLDHPDHRKLHSISTPRLGGISLLFGWTLVLVAAAQGLAGEAAAAALTHTPLGAIVTAAAIIFAVGLCDDVRRLGPAVKMAGEVAAALVVVHAGIRIEHVTIFGVTYALGSWAAAATVLWIVGITNAFNLVDGLDGLATGLAIIAGATCTAVVVLRGEYGTAIILSALLGALVGFLPFNFNPATIFLGDSGSLLTGFVLSVTAITGWQKGATALAVGVPVLIFGVPIVDTATTVLRRLVGGGRSDAPGRRLARLVVADRRHLHHQLLHRGLSHRAAVLVLYAVAICLSAVALLTAAR